MLPMADAAAADDFGLGASPLLVSTTREWEDDAEDSDDAATHGGGGSGSGRQLADLMNLEADDSTGMQRATLDSFAAVPATELQDADALCFSPEQQRRHRSFSAARQLADLLPDAERAELDAGLRHAASPAQHSARRGSTAAFVAELQHRQDAAQGLTPSRRDSRGQGAAASSGHSQGFVPESPLASSLGLGEPDERAELTAVLNGRSPGTASRGRCGGRSFFGRFAFKGAELAS